MRASARELRRHDVVLYAAGLTFYAAVGLLPTLLIAVRLASTLLGDGLVRQAGDALARFTPSSLGISPGIRHLAAAGTQLGWGAVVAAVLPASLYSEGYVRALDRLAAGERRTRRRGLRGRLLFVPIVVGTTGAVIVGLVLLRALGGGVGRGLGPRLLGTYLAFLVLWVLATALLVPLYREFTLERPQPFALLWGAAAAASWVAGQTLGFVFVLRFINGVGRAYGGSAVAGALVVAGGLLFLTHLVFLLGFELTRQIEARSATRALTALQRVPVAA